MSGRFLKLRVEGPGTAAQTYAFTAPARIHIGRAIEAEIRIGDRFSGRRHARIELGSTHCAVLDMNSANGTLVNGRSLERETRLLEAGDRITIGETVLEVLEAPGEEITAEHAAIPLERIEAELLANIAGADGDSRLVYADWLEGRGKLAHAEFLRLQEELHAAVEIDGWELRTERLRELAASIDVQWRRVVGRPAIEGCTGEGCPEDWSGLAPTKRTGVRRCGACARDVYYALGVGEAREHAVRGRCVVLDVAAVRWKQDLDGPFGHHACARCRADLGPAYLEACPLCGAARNGMVEA